MYVRQPCGHVCALHSSPQSSSNVMGGPAGGDGAEGGEGDGTGGDCGAGGGLGGGRGGWLTAREEMVRVSGEREVAAAMAD